MLKATHLTKCYIKITCKLDMCLSNTQFPRYFLFCDEGMFSTNALTLVGTKITPYTCK